MANFIKMSEKKVVESHCYGYTDETILEAPYVGNDDGHAMGRALEEKFTRRCFDGLSSRGSVSIYNVSIDPTRKVVRWTHSYYVGE